MAAGRAGSWELVDSCLEAKAGPEIKAELES